MPLRAVQEVDRRPLANTTGQDLRRYEDALNPFLLTDCHSVMPAWPAFAANMAEYLGRYAALLDTIPAEVTAMATETEASVSQRVGHSSSSMTALAESGEPGCREAPRYYGGHHDVRLHPDPKACKIVHSSHDAGECAAARASLAGTSSRAAGAGPRRSPAVSLLDPDQSHGDALAALDASEPAYGGLCSAHRAVYRWTGGVDILDDPQQVHRELLEQRVHQLAGCASASTGCPASASQRQKLRHAHAGASAAVPSISLPASSEDGDDESDCDRDSSTAVEGVGCTTNTDDDDDALDGENSRSASKAAPRLPDRRPELTLREALRVLESRHSSVQLAQSLSASTSTEESAFSPFADVADATLPQHIRAELRQYPGSLYLKAPLSSLSDLCDALELDKLLFASQTGSAGKVAIKPSALALQGTSYAAWLFVGEAGAGTRSHANVSASHGWHILLRGTKKWRIAHPLDRHLVCSPTTGALSDLFQDSTLRPEAQQHARVFEVTQHAGEALFLPSEAVYTDLCLEDSVAIHVNFYDATTAWQEKRFKRLYTFLLAPTNRDAMFPTLVPLTMVDLVLFADNVYPSFRGKNRAYRPNTVQDVLVLRGFAEFTQVRLPCSELGARVELESMQACFGAVGKYLLERYEPARYAVGVPKGYIACEKEHRLLLFYYVKPASLAQVHEALAQPDFRKATEGGRRPLQWFARKQVTLPDIDYFHSTCSHQGLVPNYVPLNVLLGQSWPFERDLCRYLVSLPRIILDKAYNPRGFIRPGSVWHYSRFDLDDPSTDSKGRQRGSRVDDSAVDQWRRASAAKARSAGSSDTHGATTDAQHGTLLHPVRAADAGSDMALDESNSSHGSRPSHCVMSAPVEQNESFSTMPASFAHSFVNVEAVEHHPGSGWCRTFLFYCSSLLDTPVTMHPVAASQGLQDSESLLSNGIRSKFHPRILEFVWNVNMLEEYGLVSLLQLETTHETAEAVITRKILHAPCFPDFEDFLELHALRRLEHDKENYVEKVMAAVLWFTCTPCIVGFVSGTSTGGGGGRASCQFDSASGPAGAAEHDAYSPSGGPGYVPFLDSDPEEPRGKWDTVCLTATAASALLECVPVSPYAIIVSRLSNWLCDEYEERGEVHEAQVLELVQSSVNSHDVERQAVVFEVLRIKRQAYEHQQCQLSSAAGTTPSATDTPLSDCRRVNPKKLERIEKMFADFKLKPPCVLPCLTPSL